MNVLYMLLLRISSNASSATICQDYDYTDSNISLLSTSLDKLVEYDPLGRDDTEDKETGGFSKEEVRLPLIIMLENEGAEPDEPKIDEITPASFVRLSRKLP